MASEFHAGDVEGGDVAATGRRQAQHQLPASHDGIQGRMIAALLRLTPQQRLMALFGVLLCMVGITNIIHPPGSTAAPPKLVGPSERTSIENIRHGTFRDRDAKVRLPAGLQSIDGTACHALSLTNTFVRSVRTPRYTQPLNLRLRGTNHRLAAMSTLRCWRCYLWTILRTPHHHQSPRPRSPRLPMRRH